MRLVYLFYIDESGAPYSWSPTAEYFVLSCTILHNNEWHKLDSAITSIKRKYFPSADLSTIEIKGSDIWNSKENFAGFDPIKINSIMTDLCSVVSQNDIRIISLLVKKQEFLFHHSDLDMLTEIWKYMLERIEMFLTGEGGREHGLIVMDSVNHEEDKKRNKLLDSFRMFGTGRVDLNHILEITFTDSGLKNVIQLTDVIAYITNLHKRNSTTSSVSPYWNAIESRFRRDATGNYHGVGYKEIP